MQGSNMLWKGKKFLLLIRHRLRTLFLFMINTVTVYPARVPSIFFVVCVAHLFSLLCCVVCLFLSVLCQMFRAGLKRIGPIAPDWVLR
jgi:hypothetical protein